MKNFRFSTVYAAEPQAVFDALTTQAGLSGWWARDCEVRPEVGFVMTFQLMGPAVPRSTFRIDALVPFSEVIWTCLAHEAHDREWVGTRLIFRLSPHGTGGCAFEFTHEGLTPEVPCYSHCSQVWPSFFLEELKQFLESKKR